RALQQAKGERETASRSLPRHRHALSRFVVPTPTVGSEFFVMPGLDPGSRRNEVPAAASGFEETARGIHVFLSPARRAWIAGSSPAMTCRRTQKPTAGDATRA